MTTPFWTLDRVAEALAEEVVSPAPRGPVPLHAISTDTRRIGTGDLFVALAGENFDAHDFLAEAVSKGAAALVVSDGRRAAGLGVPVYETRDTLVALGALGRHRRRAWGRPVVGIAGSNGKTSTKELTKAALGAVLRVHATEGNLNNRVGVPLTLLALPDEADIAVVELGTNVPGEVATVRAIAEPEIAVVTCIAEEHLEGLCDLAGVLREESDVFDGAAAAITPAAQPEVAAAARGRARRVISAGLEGGDLRADRWEIGPDGLGCIEVEGISVRPPLRGVHNLRNAMLALAVARECGVSLADAARGIAAMPQPKMRSAWEPLGRGVLINDAYNANPGSTRAALDMLAAAGQGRQRVAVLGTMREMGEQTRRVHDEIAREAVASSIEVLAGVGEFATALQSAAGADPRVVTAPDVDELWPRLEPRLAADPVILLKASRGVKLERLVPYLTAWASR